MSPKSSRASQSRAAPLPAAWGRWQEPAGLGQERGREGSVTPPAPSSMREIPWKPPIPSFLRRLGFTRMYLMGASRTQPRLDIK